MSEPTDRILAKIRKCLALAQSDNPHEAAAALRQAQKLMVDKITALKIQPELETALTKKIKEICGDGRTSPPKRGVDVAGFAEGLAAGSKASLYRAASDSPAVGKLTQ